MLTTLSLATGLLCLPLAYYGYRDPIPRKADTTASIGILLVLSGGISALCT